MAIYFNLICRHYIIIIYTIKLYYLHYLQNIKIQFIVWVINYNKQNYYSEMKYYEIYMHILYCKCIVYLIKVYYCFGCT